MDKKTKLMAICAAGAAAILIGAGLARCAIAPSDPNPVVPVEEQSRQAEQAGESLAGYAGTTWESEDGTCTLTLSDSTIVESGEAGVQVMYYEVLSEEPDDDGLSAQISFTRSAGEAASQTLLSINDTGGRKSISCDAFALSKRDACNWMFTNQVAVLSSIGYEGIIGADFSQMLTTAGDVSMYDIARGVWDAAVLPIGCGVLGLVFTVKLIQISQRMDGNASFPGVKEVVFLLVFFAVFLFLIQNSFELMEAIYAVVGLAIDRTMSLFGSGGAIDLTAVSVVTEDDDVPALIALLLVSVISWVVVLGAYIVALVVCWARAIQLYIMAAFSPIPLSLMALDDTRQIGIGYLKNFTAVCLAGLIILILLIAFPLILGGLTGASTSTGTPIDGIATGLTYALQYLAMCVLLILSLVKSGAWARDIVSGI